MKLRFPALLILVFGCLVQPLAAHELQSVVLRLDEGQAGQVSVMLKTPLARDGRPVAIVPRFPEQCRDQGETRVTRVTREAGVVIREWMMICEGGLAGKRLRIEGLDPRTPDAIVAVHYVAGSDQTLAIDRHDPGVSLQPEAAVHPVSSMSAYLTIGIEHILLGPDHLLFVLGLMLVVAVSGRSTRMLVASLTAFTLAHSLTLAMAVLGIWGLPPKPVEILIALSIVLLALELADQPRRLQAGLPPSLTLRRPWLIAFGFGLLHGFGFAGALTRIGLPEEARGWALFLFNVGIEIGQLIFVAAMLLIVWLLRRLHRPALPAGGATTAVTVLGGLAMYWVLDRTLMWSASLMMGMGS